MIAHMALGFIGGVCFMLVLSALDGMLYRRTMRKADRERFDAEVEKIMARHFKTKQRIAENNGLLERTPKET